MKQLSTAFLFISCVLLAVPTFAQSKPVDLSLGWNYAHNNEGDGFSNLNGWYGTAVWEFSKRVGLAVSHESYWGAYARAGENEHVYLGGVSVKLRKGDPRIVPFVQPFGGVTRSSAIGSVHDQATFELAGGFDVRLHGKLAFEVIPAEYVLANSNGRALSSYQTAAGFAYTFKKH